MRSRWSGVDLDLMSGKVLVEAEQFDGEGFYENFSKELGISLIRTI